MTKQREIKFRAWDIVGKRWWLPNTEYEADEGAEVFFAIEKWFIRFNRGDITLMQFTGLKDKNGKEIYEEDILKSGVSDVICKINIGHYDDTSSSQHDIMGVWFNIVGEKKPYGFAKAVLTKDSCNIMEVIGNIYDNPELVN